MNREHAKELIEKLKMVECTKCHSHIQYENDDLFPDDDYPDVGYLYCPFCEFDQIEVEF